MVFFNSIVRKIVPPEGGAEVRNEEIRIDSTLPFRPGSGFKKEIDDLGYDISKVEDGRVTFLGDEEAVCRANVFLRTAERILIKVGSFRAETFEELFQGTAGLAWEEYIPRDGKFWIKKAGSVKSKLFSPSDIQSVMKKRW